MSGDQYERPVVVEPTREVVEVDDEHGTVYFGDPVPVYPGDTVAPPLDDLPDVDAPPSQPGLLERHDGRVRVVPRAEIGTEVATQLVNTHIAAAEPHPAYDDLPSLTLLFENGLI